MASHRRRLPLYVAYHHLFRIRDGVSFVGVRVFVRSQWYKQYINPLPIQKAFPAVTNSVNVGQGLDWLQQFIDSCGASDPCYGDYINLVPI